jgi:hypothetical protein
MDGITNEKFIYSSEELILQRNNTGIHTEVHMSALTITQTQGKGLRHYFDGLREFATGLYAAQGGWLKPRAVAAVQAISARRQARSQRKLLALAKHVETYSPSLSVELRYLASRG